MGWVLKSKRCCKSTIGMADAKETECAGAADGHEMQQRRSKRWEVLHFCWEVIPELRLRMSLPPRSKEEEKSIQDGEECGAVWGRTGKGDSAGWIVRSEASWYDSEHKVRQGVAVRSEVEELSKGQGHRGPCVPCQGPRLSGSLSLNKDAQFHHLCSFKSCRCLTLPPSNTGAIHWSFMRSPFFHFLFNLFL